MSVVRASSLPVLLAFVLGAAACAPPPFEVRGTVGQVYVTHAEPGDELVLRAVPTDEVLARGAADRLGSFVFRKVPPGEVVVERPGAFLPERAPPVRVLSVAESRPDPDFYASQVLKPGPGYITMRDGTTLSVYVRLPGPPELGPYPTLVNYSGYAPARPGTVVAPPVFEELCGDGYPVLCDAPQFASGILAGIAGYATVGVNIRGTGCSGGAYDFFDTLQLLDGYDVIEIVAAQDWVQHHHVGMVGLSYPGISQLFVGSMRPPSLAAIAPLAVLGNSAEVMRPGGILNDGFAINWVDFVIDDARPFDKRWVRDAVAAGDLECAENQLLHDQLVDNVAVARATPYYVPEIVDPVNPELRVGDIEVPVFLAGAWQDEQTGPGFHTLLNRFDAAPFTRFMLYNGVHPDGYAPQIVVEWKAFLDFYVRRELVPYSGVAKTLVPLFTGEAFGADMNLPAERFAERDDFDAALAEWEAEPRFRVLFENGAHPDEANGAPRAAFATSFDTWPPAPDAARRFYLQPGGQLAAAPPIRRQSSSSYTPDLEEGQRGVLAPGARIWDRVPEWDWRDPSPTHGVAFESEPLAANVVTVGPASVDLWVRSTASDADLEVTISEVRADGVEVYVQSGWLRASHRRLDEQASTPLFPRHTHLEKDAAPLPAGEFSNIRVAVDAFAHVFRAGSKVRLAVDTPGGSRADWRFELLELPEDAVHELAHDAARPSSLLLPVVPGVEVPSEVPPCPGLRGQMCRSAAP